MPTLKVKARSSMGERIVFDGREIDSRVGGSA